jgi:hypothetical protein
MRLRDPKADPERDGRPDSAVFVAGERVPIADDGTFEHPVIDRAWAEGYAERNGFDVDAVLVSHGEDEETDICGATMSDGSTCERPADECPYH